MEPSVRPPSAAGQFYPPEKGDLLSLLNQMESEAKNSGPDVTAEVKGLVVPHAGYMFSGKTAMAGYLRLKGKGNGHFILIGPNHSSEPYSTSVYPSGNWETPIGPVKVDNEVSGRILEKDGKCIPDRKAHFAEHSLEVQVPFLQYITGDMVNITPILMGNQEKKVAIGMAKTLHELAFGIPLIISTDLNHYENLNATIRKDSLLVDSITSLDVNRLYRVLEKDKISACGYGPVAVLMEYMRLEGGRIDLIDHSTSYHYSGDMQRVVGYAALAATH